MGTFNYMSPEQARGLQVDAHTDIFSLGVVTHEMIAGQAPFAGETPSDVIAALLTGSPPPLRQYRAEVPAELERIVVKALRKDREERYQSSEELLADLQSFKQEWEFKARLSDSAASEATRPARFLMAVIAGRDRGWPAALIILLAATALMLVAAAGVYFWRADRQAADAGAIKSIAVLPFKTIGAKSEEEFLGLGMADVLITRLSRTGKLAVSPTEAVRRYGEKGSDPLATGHALGVAAVLTGNVQQSGDRLRVTVQLLRVGDGLPVWADQFDERLTDIFTLQDQISQRLAGALTLKLTGDERRRLTENQTASVEAYQLYLEGRYYWARRTPEWVRKAIVCFEQSARLDPNYAQAYAGLADSYAITASGLPPQERLPKAKAAAERALALDESLAEAHTSLAFILYKFEWNWLEAENHFRRALELNPNYSIGQHWFGECLALMGRFDEGLARLHEAERLDPLSLSIKNDLGRALYRARRYDEAIAQARKTLELAPDFRNAHWTIMYACEQQGRLAEAVEADLQALRLSKVAPARIEELRAAFAASGWAGYWRRQLAQTRERARNEYVPAYFFAEIHMRLGNQEAAFRALEKSYEELGDGPLFVRVEPPLDALRSDLRFAHFLRRSGLDGR
jgi:TolB-like protein/Flp pilus assembly protein TadD